MNTQIIFYVIGVIFLFSTIVYFAYEYLYMLSDLVKTMMLTCLTIASFFLAEYFKERDL